MIATRECPSREIILTSDGVSELEVKLWPEYLATGQDVMFDIATQGTQQLYAMNLTVVKIIWNSAGIITETQRIFHQRIFQS